MPRIVVLLTAVLALACQFGDAIPTPGPVPVTCGDGTCQTGSEHCGNCSKDCGSCCAAVSARGSGSAVVNAENALGDADQKVATLGPFAVLELVIGREVTNSVGGTDFQIIGNVSSGGTTAQAACPLFSSGSGLFEIKVSADGVRYETIGFWTQKNDTFELGCRSFKAARYIRIVGLSGASGEVDAIRATACGAP